MESYGYTIKPLRCLGGHNVARLLYKPFYSVTLSCFYRNAFFFQFVSILYAQIKFFTLIFSMFKCLAWKEIADNVPFTVY